MRAKFVTQFLFTASICLSLSAGAHAAPQGYIPEGYWASYENLPDYEFFIRIESEQGKATKGVHCSLDGKSASWSFIVAGDSIVHRSTYKEAITWYPGSGDLALSGVEKEVPYTLRYRSTDAKTYWAKCADEEKALTVAVRPPRRADALASGAATQAIARDALGRAYRIPPKAGFSIPTP